MANRWRPPRERIAGVDLARGLAVIGMIGAHTLHTSHDLGWDPSTWDALVHGRPSILFAVLAGVSAALMTGGAHRFTGPTLRDARTRLLARAVTIFALGIAIVLAFGAAGNILPVYAILLVAVLPVLRWSTRRLALLAVALLVVTPVLLAFAHHGITNRDRGTSEVAEYFVTGPYPALVWVTFTVLGLLVGRLDLTSAKTAVRLTLTGALLACVGYTAGWATTRLGSARGWVGDGRGALPVGPPPGGGEDVPETPARSFDLTQLLGAEPHTATTSEVIGSGGVALLVLGLCLLAPRGVRAVLYPLRAAGTMPLTIYLLHYVGTMPIEEHLREHGTAYFAGQVVVGLTAASLWLRWRRQGPLEQMVAAVARKTASCGSAAETGAGSAPVPGIGSRAGARPPAHL